LLAGAAFTSRSALAMDWNYPTPVSDPPLRGPDGAAPGSMAGDDQVVLCPTIGVQVEKGGDDEGTSLGSWPNALFDNTLG
jgi:hypothetical protein